jgi:hypothetical protein
MSEENEKTYFYNTDRKLLGDCSSLLSIPLYKGMKMSIHPYDKEYEVVDWNFHWGQPDEKSGLRIFLKETSTKAEYLDFKV